MRILFIFFSIVFSTLLFGQEKHNFRLGINVGPQLFGPVSKGYFLPISTGLTAEYKKFSLKCNWIFYTKNDFDLKFSNGYDFAFRFLFNKNRSGLSIGHTGIYGIERIENIEQELQPGIILYSHRDNRNVMKAYFFDYLHNFRIIENLEIAASVGVGKYTLDNYSRDSYGNYP